MITKKICLIGDFAVGKSSLVRRLTQRKFSESYQSTIGARINSIPVSVETPFLTQDVNVLLWDMMSCELASEMHASYLHGCDGAVLVADATRPETALSIISEFAAIRTHAPYAQLALAVNKSDRGLCEEINTLIHYLSDDLDIRSYLTSAKTGDNVEPLFEDLMGRVVDGKATLKGVHVTPATAKQVDSTLQLLNPPLTQADSILEATPWFSYELFSEQHFSQTGS